GIVGEGEGQGDDDHDEGDGLLGHAEDGAAEGEAEHDDGDDHDLPSLGGPDHVGEAATDGAGGFHDLEGAAQHENEDDDPGRILEPAERGAGHVVEALGLGADLVAGSEGAVREDALVRAGDDDGAAVPLYTLELARWDDPGQRGRDQEQPGDEHERVGDAVGERPAGRPDGGGGCDVDVDSVIGHGLPGALVASFARSNGDSAITAGRAPGSGRGGGA